MKALRADAHEIARTLAALFQAGDVIEMRVPKAEREGTVSGYFNNPDALAQALAAPNGHYPGIYVTLNPVNPSLLARAANRIRQHVKTTTADKDILRRRWLLIDGDAVRPAEISSTDIEHEAALERVRQIRFDLAEEGFPAPILADSGNGGHLLYLIDLPNDDDAAKLVEGVLKTLAARYDDASVKIDQTVFNASRITKAYGTVVRKGDNIPDRPHRLSRILDIPQALEVVSRESLAQLAPPVSQKAAPPRAGAAPSHRFDLEGFIGRHLQARAPVSHEGGRKWVLEECPFNQEHRAPDAAIFEQPDGSIGFKCFHNSCSDRAWKDVRALFEPRVERSQPEHHRAPQSRLEPPKVLTYSELKKVETPVTKMLFEEYPLPASGATLMFGQSRSGKTILAVQQALAVARGKPLFDNYRTLKPGAVMIVEQDDQAGTESIRDLVEHSGGGAEDMPFFTVPKLQFGFGPALLEWLDKQIRERKLVMVVLDSYTALRGPRGAGIDIVKAEQVELSQLDELGKRLQCSIVVIHHDSTGKAAKGLEWTQSAAGTFAMTMATEAQVHVARFADLDIKAPERLVRIRPRHGTDLHIVLRFREKTEDYEHVLENSAAAFYPLMKQIEAEFGRRAFGVGELTHATGVSRATAHRQLARLLFAGVVQKNGHEYSLAVRL